MAGMSPSDYAPDSEDEEEILEEPEEDNTLEEIIEVPIEDVPIDIMKSFYSFLDSRRRPVLKKELGHSISRFTSRSVRGAISKEVLTGDPYTDLKTVLFNAKTREFTPSGLKLIRKLFEEISDDENYKLYLLCNSDPERRNFFLQYGRIEGRVRNNLLRQAVEDGDIDMVLDLVKGADRGVINETFTRAAAHGNIEIMRILIENRANIHTHNDEALIVAARNGHLNVVRFLIEENGVVANPHDIVLTAALFRHEHIRNYIQNLP